jgi:hypothetical protein
MPAVIETHARAMEHIETSDVSREDRPQTRQPRPGCWHTRAHAITTYLTPMSRARHAPVDRAHRPFETPMDRFVRENPYLVIYALALL